MSDRPADRDEVDTDIHNIESEPLLEDETTGQQVPEDPDEEELNRFQLFALTCSLGGLQVVWAILFSNINTYLTSIGFPNSVAAAIWVIAPACGATVQPMVGYVSDRTRSRFGRRKPYMLVGLILTSISFIGLMYSENIATAINSKSHKTAALTGVTLTWVILLNVSIQPLQMAIRAIIVDGCPKTQQAQANAWAGGALGVGNVFGYLISYATDSFKIHTVGFDRYKLLAIIASASVAITVAVTVTFAKERYGQPITSDQEKATIATVFRQLRRSRMVSYRAKIVNRVQLFAWLGWFPFMFYQVAYVSSLSQQHMKGMNQPPTTEAGTRAAFLYAVLSCVGSLIIPVLLRKSQKSTGADDNEDDANSNSSPTPSAPPATMLGIPLEKIWCASQIAFGTLMILTIVAFNPAGATVIVALVGFCFAFSNYIPYALIGIEVAESRKRQSQQQDTSSDNEGEEVDEGGLSQGGVTLGTGATQGILNASISAPQIVSALVGSAVLALCDKVHLQDAYGWVLRLAGLAALAAAWQTRNLFRS